MELYSQALVPSVCLEILGCLTSNELREQRLVSKRSRELVDQLTQQYLQLHYRIPPVLPPKEVQLAYYLLTCEHEHREKPSWNNKAFSNYQRKLLQSLHFPLEFLVAWWQLRPRKPRKSRCDSAGDYSSVFLCSLLTGRKEFTPIQAKFFEEIREALVITLRGLHSFSGMDSLVKLGTYIPSLPWKELKFIQLQELTILDKLYQLHPDLEFRSIELREPAFYCVTRDTKFEEVVPTYTTLELRWPFKKITNFIFDCKLSKLTCKNVQCLPTCLFLGGNVLAELGEEMIPPGAYNLQELHLRGNPLKQIHFTYPIYVRYMDLTNCGLTEVPTSVVTQMPNLRKLVLCRNQLTDVPVFQPSLTQLSLNNNYLTKLSEKFLKTIQNYNFLDLSNNQLNELCLYGQVEIELSHTRLSDLNVILLGNPLQEILVEDRGNRNAFPLVGSGDVIFTIDDITRRIRNDK